MRKVPQTCILSSRNGNILRDTTRKMQVMARVRPCFLVKVGLEEAEVLASKNCMSQRYLA